MAKVVVVVDALANEGRADELLAAWETCLRETHQEPGCELYALHRASDDPNHLMSIERWASQEAFEGHMAKPYVADLIAAASAPGVLAKPFTLTPANGLALGDPAKGTVAPETT